MQITPKMVAQAAQHPLVAGYESRKFRRKGMSAGLPFGAWNQPWNISGGTWAIGLCMKLINETNPASYVEWHEAYMAAYGEKLTEAAEGFVAWCQEQHDNPHLYAMTKEIAIIHATIHAIDETWEGWRRERDLCELLQEALLAAGRDDLRVECASTRIDMLYKIDAEIVDSEGYLLAGVQIKTNRLFEDFKAGAKWRRSFSEAHAAYRANEGAPAFFLSFENECGKERKPLLRKEAGTQPNGDVAYTVFEDLTAILDEM